MKSLMGAAYAEAVRRGDGQVVFSLLIEAVDVVWNLRHSLTPTALAQDPYHGRLWAHSDKFPDQTKAGPWTLERWTPDQQVVVGAAADYLKHPWMSDGHIDWCCVDALTRREIVGYEEAVASTFPKQWTTEWVLQKFFAVWIPFDGPGRRRWWKLPSACRLCTAVTPSYRARFSTRHGLGTLCSPRQAWCPMVECYVAAARGSHHARPAPNG